MTGSTDGTSSQRLVPAAPEQEDNRSSARTYWSLTRTHTYSLLFVLPLFVAYELLAMAMGRFTEVDLRNAADVIVRSVLASLGLQGTRALFAVIIVVAIALIVYEQRRQRVRVRARVFAGMFVESVVLALCFGAVVSRLTAMLLPTMSVPADALSARLVPNGLLSTQPLLAQLVPTHLLSTLATNAAVESLPLPQQLVLSLGAGLYEELVFRVILVTGIAWLVNRLPGVSGLAAGVIAVVLSALVFSVFHYVGAYGDTFELASFTFRFIGGVVFSAIYLLRGFGIVAWTHALYDVFLLTSMALF